MSTARRLTGADKRQIEAAIANAKRQDKRHKSAQDSIPFQRMFPDGICRVTDTYYTKTIQFQDINYQLSQNEDKTAIFDGWCDFLNYFNASVHFQLTFLNMAANKDTYGTQITIPLRGDEDDAIRTEYTQMLRDQLAKGNNGLIKTKYLTFGIEADGMKTAKPRLERIETDVLNNFKRLGVAAEPLNGTDRLRLLHDMLRIDDPAPFRFSWDWLASSGLSAKDFIAPSSFEFAKGNYFGIGQKRGAVSFLQILAPELNDRMLADFLDMESSLIVTMHVQSVDQVSAIKTIKRKITDLDRMKIEEQKKAVRSGYDMDIIPSDLATYGAEAKKLLQELQSRNERMFLLTFLVLNIADSVPKLRNNVFQASSIAQKYNCQLVRLDFRQEEGLMSSLPLGLNQVEIQRSLTTSAVAIFVPFTTQELYQNGSEALYCGLNALSNNLIMVDRKFLKNPNGLILGTPGSGKSFAAKREIANVFFVTTDDIIICDPEAEYGPLVERLHGQVIKISPTSPHYINPMDLNLNYSDDENPLSLKSDFILSLCELIVGGKDGLQPVEKTIIDRCVRMVYRDYLNDPKPENMPVLEDLYHELRRQEEKEAQYVATALEIYVTGSLNVFNHRTNVDIQNRIVAFDIKELGKQLKKIGMLVVQDQVWNRVTINREAHKATRYYIIGAPQTPSLLIDIDAKIRAGKGVGYQRWASKFNAKQLGQTMTYLKEHDLMNYADLKKKTQAATEQFHALSAQIKSAEARMAEIAVLRGHIVNFAKTKKTFDAYKASGYTKKFLAEHEAEILLHRSAKRAFQELNVKKLPTVKSLQEEYAKLLSEKKAAYPDYRKAKQEMQELLTVQANVAKILGAEPREAEHEKKQKQR